MIRRNTLLFLYISIILLSSGFVSAQTAPADRASHRGDYLTLKIAVFGPGDPLYVWWGHIGLIVQDDLSGKSRFYDYGLFSFENDNFFRNFALGRLLYSCGVSPTEANIRRNQEENRDIFILTLDLTPEKKEEVWRFAENNVRPENRDYYYHHFRDNCATRIRDIIDLATDGQFGKVMTEKEGRFTYRQHVRRHTWFSPFFDWFLNFLMGNDIDEPIRAWDEMFLPSEIDRNLQDFVYTDPRGEQRSLVSSREIYYRAVDRPGVLEIPRRQWPRALAAGLAVAGLLIILKKFRQKNRKTGRIILGSIQSLMGLFLGTAGTLLYFMSFFTDHDYTWNNLNVFYVHPLFLAALPLGILVAAGSGTNRRFSPERLLRGLWTLGAGGALAVLLLRIFPGLNQQNQVSLALYLPPVLVLGHFLPWVDKLRKKIQIFKKSRREFLDS